MDIDLVALLFLVIGCAVAYSLYRAHRNSENTFNLTDLITYKGRVDNAKFCQIGAFFVSSWVVYYMTLNRGLTEWAFGLYMAAWVGARIASLIAGIKAPPKPTGEIKL